MPRCSLVFRTTLFISSRRVTLALLPQDLVSNGEHLSRCPFCPINVKNNTSKRVFDNSFASLTWMFLLFMVLANQLDALGWERIEKHMAGHKWPPAGQDWQTLKVSWDQTPKQKTLNQIADQDIRFATYFFSEVSDHTQRLKAMAHFYSLFGANSKDIALTFFVWAECAKLRVMQALTQSVKHEQTQAPLG